MSKRFVLSTPGSLGYVVAESREDLIATIAAIGELIDAPTDAEFRVDVAELPAYDPEWESVEFEFDELAFENVK